MSGLEQINPEIKSHEQCINREQYSHDYVALEFHSISIKDINKMSAILLFLRFRFRKREIF